MERVRLDFSQARIVVVGDAMTDIWHFGHWSKITGEGIPEFLIERTEEMPGGAANVHTNCKSLGAESHLFAKPHAQWPVKTRYSRPGPIERIAREDCSPIDETLVRAIMGSLEALPLPHVLVISDYAKGVCTPELCREAIGWARGHGVKVIVDPKSADWTKYQGADVITPNEHEFQTWGGPNSLLKFPNILVTYGARGMWLSSYGAKDVSIPAHTVTPKDVTGCGDSVVAALACCLAIGMPLEEAARVANAAGACAVSHQGTHAVTRAELEAML